MDNLAGMCFLPNKISDRQCAVQNDGPESLEVDALIPPCNHLSEHMADAAVWIIYATGTVIAVIWLAECVYQQS